MLELKELAEPVKYTNFDGEEFSVTKSSTVLIRLANQEIKLPLMVEDEGKNDKISIMVGITFLEKCKPWQVTSENLIITLNHNEIIIQK